MADNDLVRRLSRRQLIQRASLLAGATLAIPVLQACSQPAAQPAAPTSAPKPAATTAPAAPAAGATTAPATSGFDWTKYKGTKLRVMLAKQPWTDFIDTQIDQFKKDTGVDLQYEVLPEDQFRPKLTVEFTSGASSIDVFHTMVGQDGLKYDSAGWFTDFKPLLGDSKITAPDYDWADYTEGALKVSTVKGKQVGIPVYLETTNLFYRKDLFEAQGLKPPTTFDELMTTAAKFTDKSKDQVGWVSRGKQAAATSQWVVWLYGYGGTWLKDGQPAMNSPEAIKAFETYGKALRDYGPDGSVGYHWLQCQQLFGAGKAAMWMDGNILGAQLEDPSISQIAGKIGYALPPGGPKPAPVLSGWVLSIFEKSKNKEAAWMFIQYMTSKKLTAQAMAKGVVSPRTSAWNDPLYKDGVGAKRPDFTTANLEAFKIGNPDWNPPVIPVAEVRDAVGATIVDAIQGSDVKASAERCNQQFKDILAKAG